MIRVRPHDCAEEIGLPCGVCERAIDQLEAERNEWDDGMSDLLADRYEKDVIGI